MILDVAMVIITTMIAKIYFPESLDRGGPAFARSTQFIRVPESETSASYYSDTSDNEGDVIDEEDEEAGEKSNKKKDSRPAGEFLEFEQATSSKMEVIKRLLFCSLMLNVTFVTWGLLQV